MANAAKLDVVHRDGFPQVVAVVEGVERWHFGQGQGGNDGIGPRLVKEGNGATLHPIAQHPVLGGFDPPPGPALQDLAKVNRQRAFGRRDIEPGAVAVLGLQTVHTVLCQQGQKTSVGMGPPGQVTALSLVLGPHRFIGNSHQGLRRAQRVANEAQGGDALFKGGVKRGLGQPQATRHGTHQRGTQTAHGHVILRGGGTPLRQRMLWR